MELDLNALLDIKVVSSTKTEKSIGDAPSTIYSFKGDTLRQSGIRRLTDLIGRFVPGAAVTEDGDSIALSFRGIASDNNAKVLLLLNGHHYNTQWNNGPTSEIELSMLDDIDRIEVVVGPGAALFGSGATMAVINMITKTGESFDGAQFQGDVGNGQFYRGSVHLGENWRAARETTLSPLAHLRHLDMTTMNRAFCV